MRPHRREVLQWTAGLSAMLANPTSLGALSYPSRAVHLIVGFPPGGTADAVARIIATRLSERLGQRVIVEYRSGAGTNIATRAVLGLPSDGHSLLLMGSSTVVNALLHERTQPKLLQSILPVVGLTVSAFVIAVNSSDQRKTLADLLAHAKANPRVIRVGTYGVGTQSHVVVQLFCKFADIELDLVPYQGSALMIKDLLGQHIDVAFDSVGSVIPHIKSGALCALGVTSPDRLTRIWPEVPAVAEIVPGYEAISWAGLAVREGTPSDIIQRLHHECIAILNDPTVIALLIDRNLDTMLYNQKEFAAFWSEEVRRTRSVIHALGVRLE